MNDASIWDEMHKSLYNPQEFVPSSYAVEKEKSFPKGSQVIDLGGGTGMDAVYFLEKGHKVTILDISDYALSIAKKVAEEKGLGKNLICIKTDFGLDDLPILSESCDVAYSRIALNYFPRKETSQIFASIYKALKKGGKAYITLKSPDDVQEIGYLNKVAEVYEPGVFIDNGILRSRFSKEDLGTMLVNSGISKFSVNAYCENLGESGGKKLQLITNEIIFEKL